MQATRILLALLVTVSANGTAVTPIEKVIELLGGLKEKVKEEKHHAAVAHASATAMCAEQKKSNENLVKSTTDEKNNLKDAIESSAAAIAAAVVEKDSLVTDISTAEGVISELDSERAKEKETYTTTVAGYEETISFLEQAIGVIPDTAESSGNNVKTMMTDLVSTFKQNKNEAQEKETKAQSTYKEDRLYQTLSISTFEKAKTKEEGTITEKEAKKAADELSFQNAEKTIEDTEELMDAAEKMCKASADSYTESEETRADEIAAIENAIALIKGAPTASASAAAMLMQLRAEPKQKMSQFLEEKGAELHSHVLSALAVQMKKSPFEEVIKLLTELKDELMKQALAETNAKSQCETDMSVCQTKIDAQASNVKTASSSIETLTASIATATAEIAKLEAEITTANTAKTKAKETLEKETEAFDEIVKDSETGESACKQALEVLTTFYSKAAGKSAYQGAQASSAGIIGLLEVIETDFTKAKDEAESDKKMAETAYKDFESETNVVIAKLTAVKNNKLSTSNDNEGNLETAKKDLQTAEDILNSAKSEMEIYKKKCVTSTEKFEERKKKREAEILALTTALGSLQ